MDIATWCFYESEDLLKDGNINPCFSRAQTRKTEAYTYKTLFD
jgi:hypothetical protein